MSGIFKLFHFFAVNGEEKDFLKFKIIEPINGPDVAVE